MIMPLIGHALKRNWKRNIFSCNNNIVASAADEGSVVADQDTDNQM